MIPIQNVANSQSDLEAKTQFNSFTKEAWWVQSRVGSYPDSLSDSITPYSDSNSMLLKTSSIYF